jgi:hypothetical protein
MGEAYRVATWRLAADVCPFHSAVTFLSHDIDLLPNQIDKLRMHIERIKILPGILLLSTDLWIIIGQTILFSWSY